MLPCSPPARHRLAGGHGRRCWPARPVAACRRLGRKLAAARAGAGPQLRHAGLRAGDHAARHAQALLVRQHHVHAHLLAGGHRGQQVRRDGRARGVRAGAHAAAARHGRVGGARSAGRARLHHKRADRDARLAQPALRVSAVRPHGAHALERGRRRLAHAARLALVRRDARQHLGRLALAHQGERQVNQHQHARHHDGGCEPARQRLAPVALVQDGARDDARPAHAKRDAPRPRVQRVPDAALRRAAQRAAQVRHHHLQPRQPREHQRQPVVRLLQPGLARDVA
mmetsp:Transcript_36007/g.90961  ORF Transcript_36007/g.90961 Transcript_36007/m.90961 type:complete len:284 (-) Transcript_36007:859-1710(-)